MWLRLYKSFGRLAERGPEDGPKLMVIPGFVANDRTTLGLQRALAAAGYRVAGWGLGLNKGVRPDTLRAARRAGRGVRRGRQGDPGRLEPRRRLRPRARQGPARSGRQGRHPGLAFLGRPARQQCLAALRMDRRPSGRRAADRGGPAGEAAGADARPLVAPGRHRLGPLGARPAAARATARSSSTAAIWASAVSGRAYPKIVAAIRDF